MVQVLSRRPQEPRKTFAQSILGGLASGIPGAVEAYQGRQQAKNRNQTLQQLTGQDLSGLDPEMQKTYLSEMLKLEGKRGIQQEKQDYLSKLFGENPQEMKEKYFQDRLSQESSQNRQQFNPSKLTDADIARATAIDPNLGRSLQQAKNSAQEQMRHEEKQSFEKEKLDRSEAKEITTPLFKELDQSRKNIPLQEQSIEDIKNASPEVGWRDYFADVLGFEPARTTEGAKLKTAIKDFFLSDLTRAGARPNMWIEQQLADALPKIGRSAESNLITAAGMQFKVDLAKRRIETLDRISEEDREKYGYVKQNIDARAFKELKKYSIDRQKELEDEIKSIKESHAAGKVKKGTKLGPEIALDFLKKFNGNRQQAESHAKEMGYEF